MRLAALAPDLARWAVDAANALALMRDFPDPVSDAFHAEHPEAEGEAEDCIVCLTGALLARLDEMGGDLGTAGEVDPGAP